MPDDPSGFTAGSAMPPQQATSSADVGDDLTDPSAGGGSVAGSPGGGGVSPLILSGANPGAPASIGDMTSTSSLGGGMQPGAPSQPAQKPSFFKGLITQLGLALAQGAKAGVQAPMSAQGPSIAASKAISMPQEDFAAKNSRQMDTLNVAMTQLKLHQLHMVVSKMDQEQQDAAYNIGRDTLDGLANKGQVDILATGDYKAVQDEFVKRQADAASNKQGLLPLQILPAVGSTAKDPKFSLVNVGKGKLTESWEETWGANDIGVSSEDFKAAGLTTFKFSAPAGMDQQKALQMRVSAYQNWAFKSEAAVTAYKKNQATLESREGEGEKNRQLKASEGAANRALRLNIASLNDSTRKSLAAAKQAGAGGDKDMLRAQGQMITAYGKFGNKAFNELSGGDAREVRKLERASQQAHATFDGLVAAKKGATPPSAKVPTGTKITVDIARQYLQKAGGDKAKAKQLAAADGYGGF